MLPKIEKQPLSKIKEFQEEKLQEALKYLSENSKFYKDLFQKNNIDVSEIKTIEDLQKIPVTTKKDLQERNDDFLCVPKNKIIDYITTSGTLGDPVTFALTDKDLDRLAYNECISFSCSDGSSEDIYQQMVTIDKRFMAGLAYYLGARRLGAGIIRVGGGIPELQWDTIKRIKPTAFITVPSFLLKLIDYAKKNNIDYQNTGVKKAICIGEPIRDENFELNKLGKKIKESWKDLKLYSTYASTEMASAFSECSEGKGGHHHPELIITEFLDENNNPVEEGEAGELTVTTLGVEGMPLLRFKTGDVMKHYTEPCSCGRNTIRLGPVIGRKKQMIKFKGTSLYPPALYDILDDIEEVKNYIVEVYTNEIGTDEILIYVGVKNVVKKHEKIIKDRFRAKLRVAPAIIFKSPEEINKQLFPETSRKPLKFVDKRKSNIK
ncbi:MAG: phenylacetate--CoA ligase [Chlorobi bacterium]|nr:phenylacetate--CoA ligase [Chlorobiota bacterium]